MIDMKWIRNDPEKVKENIRKKFQDDKLPLVDEVVELDQKFREAKVQGDELRSQRKSISKKIGALMGQGKKEEAEAVKAEVGAIGTKLEELEKAETELSARIREIMLVIPNFIDDSVPIGKDDSENNGKRRRANRAANERHADGSSGNSAAIDDPDSVVPTGRYNELPGGSIAPRCFVACRD